MAARICMQLLCIKLSFISQKQSQICDKLSFKLSFTALNPDSVGRFVGKTSGTVPSAQLILSSTHRRRSEHGARSAQLLVQLYS
eukprot:COSAG05_NODE_123_length_17568_cov_235.438148_7_plen_84_part_00